jgi:hypothetical protein
MAAIRARATSRRRRSTTASALSKKVSRVYAKKGFGVTLRAKKS